MIALFVLLACAPGAPELAPGLVDAGDVPVGARVDLTLELRSTGPAVRVLEVVVLQDGPTHFAYSGPLPVVQRGSSTPLDVGYAPSAEGWHRAEILVHTDAGEAVAEVRAHAVAPQLQLLPGALDFGAVEPGTEALLPLVVSNQGRGPATLLDAVPTDPAFFAAGLPVVVAPGEEVRIDVGFAPTSVASVEATLGLLVDSGSAPAPALLWANACDEGLPEAYDRDQDGWTSCAGDCDDLDARVHPGAPEVCDGRDEDCDGTVDEHTPCADDDGDGWSEDEGDCNDTEAASHPEAEEILGNGVDDDCDGTVDAGTEDLDGDGFTAIGGDCAETDPDVHPAGIEVENGTDDDCDGTVDEGTTWYDDDGDGWSEVGGDCDDSDPSVHPGATEVADGVDGDCDGAVDDGTARADDDGDGWSETGGDCDDGDATVSPGAHEIEGNGIDDDCDGEAL